MFSETARFYDAVYAFKDYAKESETIHAAICAHSLTQGAKLLDVACGTGKHLAELLQWYDCEGLDLDAKLLAVARERLPEVPLHHGDMLDFELGKSFDAVTCLFGSIGYVQSVERLHLAIANMARHLKPGGVLIVEPFIDPAQFKAGFVSAQFVDQPDLKIARMSISRLEGIVAIFDFEYLIGTPEQGIEHKHEQHRLGLFARDQYLDALRNAGLKPEHDPIGPMDRGLYVGTKPL